MAETLAQKKFACPACGGEAVWNPGRRALVCASCGTETRDQASSEGLSAAPRVGDHPLDAALRAPPQYAATGAEQPAVKCRHRDVISYFDHAAAADRCPFCGSAEIVPYAAFGDRHAPESSCPCKSTTTAPATSRSNGSVIAGSRPAVCVACSAPSPSRDTTFRTGFLVPT